MSEAQQLPDQQGGKQGNRSLQARDPQIQNLQVQQLLLHPSSLQPSPEDAFCVPLPPEIYHEEILRNLAEIREALAAAIVHAQGTKRGHFSQFQAKSVKKILAINKKGKAIMLDGILQRLKVPEDKIDKRRNQIRATIKRLNTSANSGIEICHIAVPLRKKDSPTGATCKNAYYARLKQPPEALEDDEDFLAEPIRPLTDEQWSLLPSLLEKAISSSQSNSYILKTVFECLIAAAEARSAVSRKAILAELGRKNPGKVFSERELGQSILYDQSELAPKLREAGLEVIDDQERIQAIPLVKFDDCSAYDLLPAKEKANSRMLADLIKDGVRHFVSKSHGFPAKELFEILNTRDRRTGTKKYSCAELIDKLAKKGKVVSPYMLWRFIRKVRELNDLDPKCTPLGFTIEGQDEYSLVVASKPYLQAWGDHNPEAPSKLSSLYPQPQKINFEYFHFERVAKEHFPNLIYSDSDIGIIARTIAAYSAYNFKISLQVIFGILRSIKPQAKKQSAIAVLDDLKTLVEKEMVESGITLNGDVNGYWFETVVPSQRKMDVFESWYDFYAKSEMDPHVQFMDRKLDFQEFISVRGDRIATCGKHFVDWRNGLFMRIPKLGEVYEELKELKLKSHKEEVAAEDEPDDLNDQDEEDDMDLDVDDDEAASILRKYIEGMAEETVDEDPDEETDDPDESDDNDSDDEEEEPNEQQKPTKIVDIDIPSPEKSTPGIEQMVREVVSVSNGKISKGGRHLSDLRRKALYQLAIATSFGKVLLKKDLAKLIGVRDEELKEFGREFDSTRCTINQSPRTSLKVKALDLPADIEGQKVGYYLELEFNV